MLYSYSFARRLSQASPFTFVLVAGVTAFTAYFCIYAFRKPFTAGMYANEMVWGVQMKIALVLAQVAGYALSKFIGIRVIASLGISNRPTMLLGIVSIACLSLLGFALTPAPYNLIWMFLNGLPLGMAWGVIFGYLEGRKITEILAAALCTNFIISSGVAKTTGKWLLDDQGVSERWMPFWAGALFIPVLLGCVWVLEHLPPPSETDRLQRAERQSMSGADRKLLFWRYAPGLCLLVLTYLVLTIVRDFRDNFAVEIWAELGYGGQAGIFTTAELPVAALCLILVGAMVFIKRNFQAFWLNHMVTMSGAVLLIASTLLFDEKLISPLLWMIGSGFGLFLPYILFNGVLFDRFMAAFQEKGNVGFLMYMADSIGYLGSVVVMLWRNFSADSLSWLSFYSKLCYGGGILILALMGLSYSYFSHKSQQKILVLEQGQASNI
ncbi:MAG TPA: DUF5690 family protein [Saprospiraceae bacterium]|nr:DUF5690 family protein [Saprospiraceae bacterium]